MLKWSVQKLGCPTESPVHRSSHWGQSHRTFLKTVLEQALSRPGEGLGFSELLFELPHLQTGGGRRPPNRRPKMASVERAKDRRWRLLTFTYNLRISLSRSHDLHWSLTGPELQGASLHQDSLTQHNLKWPGMKLNGSLVTL